MIIIFALLTVAVFLGAALMLGLRKWAFDEGQVEARLLAPGAHTLAFVVPNGQDPVPFKAALAHASFTTVVDNTGGRERLVVECEERDRAQVRDVLEHVHAVGAAGPDQYVGDVRFDDEG
jgi:hypothetical protein